MTTVTKEETVWESFSEDEPAPKPKSKLQASTTTANSVFAQTIIDLAERKPHLIFGKGARPYVIT